LRAVRRFHLFGRDGDAFFQDKHRMRRLSSIALVAVIVVASTASSLLADVRCGPTVATRVGVAPPPSLPQTDQPPMPGYGYVWTPGSWSWNPDVNDYYWTPGAWILPPAVGLFWTPGYWAWDDGSYLYNAGYWGPHVGFYGGIRYGFGYWGQGYDGGYWQGRTFYYNRAYNNIGGLHINALYEHRARDDRSGGRASFNGGPGGVVAARTAADRLADRETHIAATGDQARRSQSAAGDRTLRASVNHGHPRLAGAAVAGHAAASRLSAGSGQDRRVQGDHTPAIHADRRVASASHAAHGSPAHRHETSQPRREAGYGRSAPAHRVSPREMSRPSHAETQHFASPRQAPAREGPPHQGGERRPH
jgi:hypothetical protein